MAVRKKKTSGDDPDAHAFQPISVIPKTDAQKEVFEEYAAGQHLFLHGSAGTGKTYIATYLALKDVLSGKVKQKRIIFVRAPKAVSDLGFMPGTLKEKIAVFEQPIQDIVDSLLINHKSGYNNLKGEETIEYMSTAYIRGLTWEDAIIIVDEAASANFHELDSIITRVGENSRIIFCGDFKQSDLERRDQMGLLDFIEIMQHMDSVSFIEFGPNDVVRSGLCREYLLTKEEMDARKPRIAA